MITYVSQDERMGIFLMDSIVQAVFEHSIATPDKAAVIVDDRKISYQQLAEKVKIFSASLKSHSIRKGQRIVLESDDLISYFAAFLGCQYSGMVAVPIEKNISEHKLQDILKSTKPSLVLRKNKGQSYDDFFDATSASGNISYPKGDATSAIIATTGTTGKPVLITHTNRSMLAEAENLSAGTDINSSTVLFTNIPFNLALGYRRVFAALYAGGAAVITNRTLTAEMLGRYIERYQINYMAVVNTNINLLLDIHDHDLIQTVSRLHTLEILAGSVTPTQIRSFRQQYPDVLLYNVYGMTESGCVLINNISQNPAENCLGKPAMHSQICIVDENGCKINTPNQYGYIAVKGNTSMSGYYHKRALTEKVMHSDFIVSSDIGYFDEDGYFYFVSRVGDILNVDGHKFSPADIEHAANGYEGITDCACAASQNPDCSHVPILYIVCSHPGFDFGEFEDYLRQHLEPYKIPQEIIPIEKIPRTATGKILRKSLNTQKI